MASKTALPIARLRSLGCKVSTIVGHDPAIADWQYRVTLPEELRDYLPGDEVRTLAVGWARAQSAHRGTIHVWACLYRTGETEDERERRQRQTPEAEINVAGLLNSIADALSKAGA
jgi:hypothetical protein